MITSLAVTEFCLKIVEMINTKNIYTDILRIELEDHWVLNILIIKGVSYFSMNRE